MIGRPFDDSNEDVPIYQLELAITLMSIAAAMDSTLSHPIRS